MSPSVATGCLIKLLHYDPITEALSFLYCMTPRFAQDNISYHDSAEESYHIWGTSWMMQFGELPTGGYFWRPPYINHGSFRCKYGTIAFGRTDSVLFNYFHFNPWTNPDENKLRAAAMMYRKRPQLYDWVASDGHNHPHGPPDFETPDYVERAAGAHAPRRAGGRQREPEQGRHCGAKGPQEEVGAPLGATGTKTAGSMPAVFFAFSRPPSAGRRTPGASAARRS